MGYKFHIAAARINFRRLGQNVKTMVEIEEQYNWLEHVC